MPGFPVPGAGVRHAVGPYHAGAARIDGTGVVQPSRRSAALASAFREKSQTDAQISQEATPESEHASTPPAEEPANQGCGVTLHVA